MNFSAKLKIDPEHIYCKASEGKSISGKIIK